MVAKITVPASIKRALNYNENKVKNGKAECLYAHNFLKEAGGLNFYEKLERFESLIALNKRATTNTLHISLNFASNEKLNKETLKEIAAIYMAKIGFGAQPYLVYQHTDAGHPHIHIVSTPIQSSGKRISLHNLGRNQSNQARKEIEEQFQLVKAEKKSQQKQVSNINTPKLTYGKAETKRSITNVIDSVIAHYKYTSLAELNAILRLYNITADRGQEKGFIHQKGGLLYRVLDEKGNKVGVPIKASAIYSQPTLKNLQNYFNINEASRQPHKKSLKTTIDWILRKSPDSLEHLKQQLQQEKISLVIRQNDAGLIYGVTFIDHRSKCVFNGSDLGKEYSASALQERFKLANHPIPSIQQSKDTHSIDSSTTLKEDITQSQAGTRIMEDLMTSTSQLQNIPYELRKRKRSKRKPKL